MYGDPRRAWRVSACSHSTDIHLAKAPWKDRRPIVIARLLLENNLVLTVGHGSPLEGKKLSSSSRIGETRSASGRVGSSPARFKRMRDRDLEREPQPCGTFEICSDGALVL